MGVKLLRINIDFLHLVDCQFNVTSEGAALLVLVRARELLVGQLTRADRLAAALVLGVNLIEEQLVEGVCLKVAAVTLAIDEHVSADNSGDFKTRQAGFSI